MPTPDPLQMLCDCLDEMVEVGWLAADAPAATRRSAAGRRCTGSPCCTWRGPCAGRTPAARDAALTHLLTAFDRGYGATTGQEVDMDDLVNDR